MVETQQGTYRVPLFTPITQSSELMGRWCFLQMLHSSSSLGVGLTWGYCGRQGEWVLISESCTVRLSYFLLPEPQSIYHVHLPAAALMTNILRLALSRSQAALQFCDIQNHLSDTQVYLPDRVLKLVTAILSLVVCWKCKLCCISRRCRITCANVKVG